MATALLSAIALLIALAVPIFRGEVYIADDLGEFHLPLRSFYAQQLSAGEAFDWCPNLYCGFYLTGEGQIGAYHPLHLVLYKFVPFWLAFDLECWLSYPLMLAGMYWFLRRCQIKPAAALFGGTVFTFGGFNLLHFVHPNAIAIIAHVPWLLVAIDFSIRSRSPLRRRCALAAIALLTGSQCLLGYPQYVLFSLLVEGGYAFYLVRANRTPRRYIWQLVSMLLAAVSVGFLIGGIQLLPTFDALQHSVRQTVSPNFATQGSLHPLNFLQLVAPYLLATRVVGQNTHELGLYLGAVPLALAVYWLASRRLGAFRALTVFAGIAAVVALLWAFGAFGPFAWFQANVPLLNRFRLPCRAIVIFQLAGAVLAGLGLHSLIERLQKQSSSSLAETAPRRLWLLPAFSVAVALFGLIFWQPYIADWQFLLAGPLFLSLAVFLIDRSARGANWAVLALIIVSALDLGTYGVSYSLAGRTDSLSNFIEATSVPPSLPTTRVVLDCGRNALSTGGAECARIGDRILLSGWKREDGYAGLEPALRLDYLQSAALRAAGVGWSNEPKLHWAAIANPQPRAWFVTDARKSADPTIEINQINLSQTALLDEPLALPPGTPGQAHVVVDRPGAITIDTACDTRQLLIINESYHSGWRAQIDGSSAEVLPADSDFMGVVVAAGDHQISLIFSPESLRWGRFVSICGLGLIVVTLLSPLAFWRGKRSPHCTQF